MSEFDEDDIGEVIGEVVRDALSGRGLGTVYVRLPVDSEYAAEVKLLEAERKEFEEDWHARAHAAYERFVARALPAYGMKNEVN